MISISINANSAEEAQHEMRMLLNGGPSSPVNVDAVMAAQAAEKTAVDKAGVGAPKRMTAAEKKAAEKAAAEAQQAISTGEERVDPEADKQDAKDEAADTKAATPEPIKLNHDSVRAMLGGYVQAYGMTAAQEDGTKIIEVPKISDLKDDQAVFAKAVIAVAQAIEKNPHKREIAGDGITAEKLAELKPFVTAALAVK